MRTESLAVAELSLNEEERWNKLFEADCVRFWEADRKGSLVQLIPVYQRIRWYEMTRRNQVVGVIPVGWG